MKKSKFKIVLLLFLIIILTGIFRVNVEYNISNKTWQDQAVYNEGNDGSGPGSKADIYSVINFSRSDSSKLRIYYRGKPFDLRIEMGNYIMYINKQAYDNAVEGKNKILRGFVDIISNGVNNVKKLLKLR